MQLLLPLQGSPPIVKLLKLTLVSDGHQWGRPRHAFLHLHCRRDLTIATITSLQMQDDFDTQLSLGKQAVFRHFMDVEHLLRECRLRVQDFQRLALKSPRRTLLPNLAHCRESRAY